jgi:hypothetical protein
MLYFGDAWNEKQHISETDLKQLEIILSYFRNVFARLTIAQTS